MNQSFIEIDGFAGEGTSGAWHYQKFVGTFIPLSACILVQRCNSLEHLQRYHINDKSVVTFPRYIARIGRGELRDALQSNVFIMYVLISESQNNRLERWLNGTTERNPIDDLVEELRYNPSFIGGPVNAAKAEFTKLKET